MVSRQVGTQHVQDDVQSPVGIQVEVPNQADDLLPYWTSATLDDAAGFCRQAGVG